MPFSWELPSPQRSDHRFASGFGSDVRDIQPQRGLVWTTGMQAPSSEWLVNCHDSFAQFFIDSHVILVCQ